MQTANKKPKRKTVYLKTMEVSDFRRNKTQCKSESLFCFYSGNSTPLQSKVKYNKYSLPTPILLAALVTRLKVCVVLLFKLMIN